MELFSRLLQTSRYLLRILAVIPLLAISAPSLAEEDIDNRERSVEFSQAELDQILAPIALYPDTVLSQVLIAATYPIEVVQAARWSSNNRSLKGADAVAKVEGKDWDPSVKALVAFPDILQRMSDDIDWTQKVGDAFLSSEERVMDSIQSLRSKAYASGSLNKVQHLKVEREHEQIIIEPAEERVVYVPVYDTRVVYGNWWWPEYPPIYWHHPASYVYVSGFYWGPSIFIGPTFFYSSCHWRTRRVVVVDHYHSHGPRPVFYTSRSIVNYQHARTWRHQPVHRRGVAYYNNDLRTRYGSQRESYQDARAYRAAQAYTEDRRVRSGEGIGVRNGGTNSRGTAGERAEQQIPRQRTFNDQNYTPPAHARGDRSEELRARLSQRNGSGNGAQNSEHSNRRETGGAQIQDQNPGAIAPPDSDDRMKNRGGSHNPLNSRDLTRSTGAEDLRARLRSQRESQDGNGLGATEPQPDRSQGELVRETTDNARAEARSREMHNDGRSARQALTDRLEQRSPRTEQAQPRQERFQRQESQPRGNSRSDEDRQVRANRAL